MNLNEKFIDLLKERIPKTSQLAKRLSDLLHMSQRSIYNRLNGTTAFTLDEVDTILNALEMDPVGLFQPLDESVAKNVTSFPSFLNYMADKWTKEVHYTENLLDSSLFVSSNYLPFALLFGYPDLVKFMLYNSYHNGSHKMNKKTSRFSPCDPIYQPLINASQYVDRVYSQIDTTEVWSLSTIKLFMRQISMAYQEGELLRVDLDLLIDQTCQLLQKTKLYALNKVKEEDPSPEIHHGKARYELIVNQLVSVAEFTVIHYQMQSQKGYRIYDPVYGSIIHEEHRNSVLNYCYRLKELGTSVAYIKNSEFLAYFDQIEDYIQRARNPDEILRLVVD